MFPHNQQQLPEQDEFDRLLLTYTNKMSSSTPNNNNNTQQQSQQQWYFPDMFGDFNLGGINNSMENQLPFTPLIEHHRNNDDCCPLNTTSSFDIDNDAITTTTTTNQKSKEKKKQKIACVYCNKLHSKYTITTYLMIVTLTIKQQ